MTRSADPTLEALWQKVLTRWDDDAAHHAFLDHCQRASSLDEAARRYRGMKGDHARSAGAEKRLGAVLLLALSTLEVSRVAAKARTNVASKLLLSLIFTLGSLLLLAYLMRS